MSTQMNMTDIPPEIQAEFQAVAEHLQTGKPIDPVLSRRITERAEKIRQQILQRQGVQNTGVQIIRELRGPLDEDQERELTLAQRDLVRRGQNRLVDPDTGTTYVLVPEDEYERLRPPPQ